MEHSKMYIKFLYQGSSNPSWKFKENQLRPFRPFVVDGNDNAISILKNNLTDYVQNSAERDHCCP